VQITRAYLNSSISIHFFFVVYAPIDRHDCGHRLIEAVSAIVRSIKKHWTLKNTIGHVPCARGDVQAAERGKEREWRVFKRQPGSETETQLRSREWIS
jgi:hypothetical protein